MRPEDSVDEIIEELMTRLCYHSNMWHMARMALLVYAPLASLAEDKERLAETTDRLMWEAIIRYAEDRIEKIHYFTANPGMRVVKNDTSE